MRIDVITIGGCTVDIVYAADGTTAGRQLGGSAIYAAVGAHLWGLRTGVIALHGTGLPDGWQDLLHALDLDLQGLVTVPLPASVSEFFYRPDGSRTERTWSPEGRDLPRPYLPADTGESIRHLSLTPSHIPDRYKQARGAHLAPLRYPAQRSLVEALSHIGILTLDPYPHVMAECSESELQALLHPLTAFLPSEEEVAARFPDLSLNRALDVFSRLGAGTIVVKRGQAGCLLYDTNSNRRYSVPSVPVVAKDPTGAGDAFCGGFLAGMIQEGDAVHAAICGSVAASSIVEDFSVRGALRFDRAERDRRYRLVREMVL